MILVKPSHYDDDGYVIQWFRSSIPSNTLATMNGLALDCQRRQVLGENVDIVVKAFDECHTRIRPRSIAREITKGRGLVALVGVQSNQFPRAMEIARQLRARNVQVCVGGFHVSGCLSMLPELPGELKEAMAQGISLFAGAAEEHLDEVLRDAWEGKLKPLYNYMDDLPALEGAPIPILPVTRIKRTAGKLTSFDAGRGCPFQCSFCTIINVQGRKSRRRSADDVEQIVRQNVAQGVNRFFITDDNFARNKDWEPVFDRLIELREKEKLDVKFVIQVDTMCHRLPHFIEKAGRAGVNRVFIGLESINPESLVGARKKQNKVAEYRKMLLEWKRVGAAVFAGYIVGFPNDTPESILHDIETIQRELPIDFLEPHCLTPLPGSEDHQKLYKAGVFLDPDLNKYDLEHVTTPHPTMTTAQWQNLYHDAWLKYYSPEHVETLLRRGVATGGNAATIRDLLVWFYACVRIEKIDPLEGGYLRRKYRRDRRSTLPIENPFVFYPRYFAETISKTLRLVGIFLRYDRFLRRLKRDPDSRNYTDEAITPVAEEITPEATELLPIVGAGAKL